MAILAALAAPAMSGMVNSMRLTTAVNSLFTSLLLARSEAIKRNSRAVVCKSVSGDACTLPPGDGSRVGSCFMMPTTMPRAMRVR